MTYVVMVRSRQPIEAWRWLCKGAYATREWAERTRDRWVAAGWEAEAIEINYDVRLP